MSDQAIIEILQSLARQRMRGDQSPLVLLRMLDARAGARISHLPIHQSLEHAWVAVTGEPFRPHQSLALASLRRGEPFALVGGGVAARRTLYLLLHDMLQNADRSRVLFLVPDEETAVRYLAELEQLSHALGRMLQATHMSTEQIQPHVFTSRVLFITPDTLHNRLLRYCNRAWRSFWNDVRLVFVTDMERYHGVAAEHLAALLLRSMRLIPLDQPLYIAVTLAETSGVEAVLGQMSNQPWRVITVNDVPLPQQLLGVWQAGTERLADAAALALACQREGHTVHIIAAHLEVPLLQRMLAKADAGISVGHVPYPADVQIIAGYPGSHAALRQALSDGIPISLLLLGNTPAERTLARLMRMDKQTIPILHDPPTTWALPAANAYISARHLLCAATELPLTETEVAGWQAGELVERLQHQGQLVRLPHHETIWQPLLAARNPYDGFGLQATGTAMALLYNEDAVLLDTLDPAGFDRWGFTGAALPLWSGGFRVVERNEAEDALILKGEQRERSTFPLRRCTVDVRDERKQRRVAAYPAGYGRVLIEEEIYGYREVCTGSSPTERMLTTPLSMRWTAPATWVDLPVHLPLEGQLCGWSLVMALPLRVLCQLTDCVPAYDAARQRLYFIDAQPGGNGLAAWLYEHLESMLPLAYDLALDSRNDGLLEPLARTDMDWTLMLLGGRMALPEIEPATRVPEAAVARSDRQQTQAAEGQTRKTPNAPTRQANAPRGTRGAGRDRGKRSRVKDPSRQPDPEHPVGHLADQEGANRSLDIPTPPQHDSPTMHRDGQSTRQPAPSEPASQQVDLPPAQDATASPQIAPPTQEQQPDPKGIIERLRQSRQQQKNVSPPAQPRFSRGDRIFCVPYGYGVIQASRIENGQQILSITFPDCGTITVNPTVNKVRLAPSDSVDDGDVL